MKKIDINKETLIKLYYDEEKNFKEISQILNVSVNTVKRRFKEYELIARDPRLVTKMYFEKKDKKVSKIKCDNCKKIFEKKNCLIGERNFCSIKCSENYNKVSKSIKRRKGKIVNCNFCGKKHYKKDSILKRGHMTFCSKDCHNKYMASDVNKGENHYHFSRVKVYCANCEKELYVTQYKYNNVKNHYCNYTCMGKHYSNTLRKENNPNWKGGYNKNGYGPYWGEISKKIRARDNYTCQRCNTHIKDLSSNHKLDVHHIIPIRNFNGDYNLANKEDNLITLCSVCHMIVENKKQ